MSFFVNRSLVKGSLILLIAFGIFNLFNFLFQLAMARQLTVEDYGVLATLSAMIYILLIFTESIQNVITKYSAEEGKRGRLKNILIKSARKGFNTSIILYILFALISYPLSVLFRIDYPLMALSGLVIFFSLVSPVTRGIMQGRKYFVSLGLNMVLEAVLKLLLAIYLVNIGLKVYGAIGGVLVGGFVALGFSFLQLRKIISSKENSHKTIGIYNYAKPTFIITGTIIIFYSMDLFIARIVFSPALAGYFAVASILSKIIFWGTLPISKAMFPLSVEDNGKNSGSSNVFRSAFFIVLAGVLAVLALFYFLPELIVRTFSGQFLPSSSGILFYLGIGTGLISISNLILLHKLSIGKVRNYQYLLVFLVFEALALYYFSGNLLQYSLAFVTSSALLLWGSLTIMNE